MKKAELLDQAIYAVKSKNLSDTDCRCYWNDIHDHAGKDGQLTEHQITNWYLTNRELAILRKATKSCSCN